MSNSSEEIYKTFVSDLVNNLEVIKNLNIVNPISIKFNEYNATGLPKSIKPSLPYKFYLDTKEYLYNNLNIMNSSEYKFELLYSMMINYNIIKSNVNLIKKGDTSNTQTSEVEYIRKLFELYLLMNINLDISNNSYFNHIQLEDDNVLDIYKNIEYINYKFIGNIDNRLIYYIYSIKFKNIPKYFIKQLKSDKELIIDKFFYSSTGTSRVGNAQQNEYFLTFGYSSLLINKEESKFHVPITFNRIGYNIRINNMNKLSIYIFNVLLNNSSFENKNLEDYIYINQGI
jgi:hypothetical protein